MSHAERCAVLHILQLVRPAVALEIGTCDGGCLEQIRHFSQKVFSIDLDPRVRRNLASEMTNVEFLTGNSGTLVKQVLDLCRARGEPPEFALVDGDHSLGGVLADLEPLLATPPTKPLWILMHDSANPGCRRGILAAGWATNPHVHLFDIDFVGGALSLAGNHRDELWGGLALALLRPERRNAPLEAIRHDQNHEALYRASILFPSISNRLRWWWRIKCKGLARRFSGLR